MPTFVAVPTALSPRCLRRWPTAVIRRCQSQFGWNTCVSLSVGRCECAPTVSTPLGVSVAGTRRRPVVPVLDVVHRQRRRKRHADLLALRQQRRGQQRPLRRQWKYRPGPDHLSGLGGQLAQASFAADARYFGQDLCPGLRRPFLFRLEHVREPRRGRHECGTDDQHAVGPRHVRYSSRPVVPVLDACSPVATLRTVRLTHPLYDS